MSDEASGSGVFPARVGYHLHLVNYASMESLRDLLRPLSLTPARATALAYVERHQGRDQTRLARALGVNAATAMATVDALVTLGAIERRRGRDRRSNELHLTPAGSALSARVRRVTAAHDRKFFAPLSPVERAHLKRLLLKLRARHVDSNVVPDPPARAGSRRRAR